MSSTDSSELYTANGPDDSQPSSSSTERGFGPGILHVKVIRAQGIKGDEFLGFGKADPYLKVQHNTHNAISPSHKNGGSDPVWNSIFSFPIRDQDMIRNNVLQVEIWNENSKSGWARGGDNCLGKVRISDLALFLLGQPNDISQQMWYEVFYVSKRLHRGKVYTSEINRGQLLMQFHFQRPGHSEIFVEEWRWTFRQASVTTFMPEVYNPHPPFLLGLPPTTTVRAAAGVGAAF